MIVKEQALRRETAEPKTQINFTAPESKIMKTSNKGWDQRGNAQALVSADQLIITCDATPQGNDVQQVEPMLQQTAKNLESIDTMLHPDDVVPTVRFAAVLNAGYYGESNE